MSAIQCRVQWCGVLCHVCTVLLCMMSAVEPTHFRGAHFWWEPVQGDDARQIRISYKIAWRRSYQQSYCDDATIVSGSLIGPGDAGYLQCVRGCGNRPVNINNMRFYCTDYSEIEDWSAGQRTYSYTFPSVGVYTLVWRGRGWADVLEQGSDLPWEFTMLVDLNVRSDTGRVNTPPVVSMETIVKLPEGCYNIIRLPVDDRDGDVVRCRWPDPDRSECGGICQAVPGISIDVARCRLLLSEALPAGFYAVPVQIEDFRDASASQRYSSVPLQFLVEIYTSDQDPSTGSSADAGSSNDPGIQDQCIVKPVFVSPPTPADEACRFLASGERFEFIILVSTKDPYTVIDEISTSSPEGMTKSAIRRYGNDPRHYFIHVTWTPTANHKGETIFCFSATDSSRQPVTSDQRCIFLSVDSLPPVPQHINITQRGPTKLFYIEYDQTVHRSTRPRSYVTIYDYYSGREVYQADTSDGAAVQYVGTRLQVPLPAYQQWESEYTVLLDEGVVRGDGRCTDSAEMLEPDILTFTFDGYTTEQLPVTTDVVIVTSTPASSDPPLTESNGDTTEAVTGDPSKTTKSPNAVGQGSIEPDEGSNTTSSYLWLVLLIVAVFVLAALVIFLGFVVKRTHSKYRSSKDPYLQSRDDPGDYYKTTKTTASAASTAKVHSSSSPHVTRGGEGGVGNAGYVFDSMYR